MRHKLKIILITAYVFCLQSTYAQPKHYLHNVTITCITKTETKTNDLIYIKLISKVCSHKNTPTKAFKNGDTKVFSEINLDDLSKKNGWCIIELDQLIVMEKDDMDEDDIIFEMKFSKTDLLQAKQCYSKTLAIGNYQIYFEIKSILL